MSFTTYTKNNSKHGAKISKDVIRRKRGKYGFLRKQELRMYGAIDLGTNNCRLLIARPTGHGFKVVSSFSRIVRLGEGLSESRSLSAKAMERTISALAICSEKLKSLDVVKTRNIATEACRRASNCSEFLARIKKETGLAFEAITSNEEARLAFGGCQPLLNLEQPHALVFDIGGGSTEVIWAKINAENFDILDVLSLQVGVVTLAEEYGTNEISNDSYRNMVNEISGQLTSFCSRNRIKQNIVENNVQMLGTSGTVTTLGAVHLNLNHYDRSLIDGLDLTFEELNYASQKLISLDFQGRSGMSCIGNERAELVVPGCAILDAICHAWPVGRLRVADRGLREGMLLGLMAEDGVPVKGNPAANSQQKNAPTPHKKAGTTV
jgi:exopolyphosphatase/guanosine-5'-triphosphate,3'-diphosphate pyrophosphatase